jgi:hypothetical protein
MVRLIPSRVRFMRLLFFAHAGRSLILAPLFWSEGRRPPRPLAFSATNESHLRYILATARLHAKYFNVSVSGMILLVCLC